MLKETMKKNMEERQKEKSKLRSINPKEERETAADRRRMEIRK